MDLVTLAFFKAWSTDYLHQNHLEYLAKNQLPVSILNLWNQVDFFPHTLKFQKHCLTIPVSTTVSLISIPVLYIVLYTYKSLSHLGCHLTLRAILLDIKNS